MNKRDFLRLLASVPVGWAGTAGAQPAGKQIRFLIPFPPGGSPDVLARKLAIELGLRSFLEEGGFKGFTTTFEDLHGLR